eukprot:1146276-Pelagomonas_calceolata.AAC.1
MCLGSFERALQLADDASLADVWYNLSQRLPSGTEQFNSFCSGELVMYVPHQVSHQLCQKLCTTNWTLLGIVCSVLQTASGCS